VSRLPIHDWLATGHETLACQVEGCGLSPLGDRAEFYAVHAGPSTEFTRTREEQLEIELAKLKTAIVRAEKMLAEPHEHKWRPDLVTCGREQDALSILRMALEATMSKEHPQSGTEAPVVDPRKTVGGGPLGDNKPIGDPGQEQQPVPDEKPEEGTVDNDVEKM